MSDAAWKEWDPVNDVPNKVTRRTFGSGFSALHAYVDGTDRLCGAEFIYPHLNLEEAEQLAKNLADAIKWMREESAQVEGGEE